MKRKSLSESITAEDTTEILFIWTMNTGGMSTRFMKTRQKGTNCWRGNTGMNRHGLTD